MKLKKQARRDAIKEQLQQNPFMTDNELSDLFSVSIQTIRLDRTYLKIPELRKRIKSVAEHNYKHIRAIEGNEIIGDLIRVEPNVTAESLIYITEDSVFTRNDIARGHILFAQANSLCVALIQKNMVLTRDSQVSFLRQVKLHDTVHAFAQVTDFGKKYITVAVSSYVKDKCVFKGTFKMYYYSEEES
ncbi:fatty acid biosynthesis transcriptional regulator [Staphylococcus piscifermentans]|uniref:Transcription factor FapR n=2 Tax=Staphylococcus TaxID=1279 RepID=A0A239U6J0_9STAP|nr:MULTISPECIES: transcription factor FapR [Staphylococcus]AYU55033.1 transcription factor FapR [Staphylococcus debuckii]RTX85787.1 transcription factor FapR [Staphylococcus piscifermentans]GEP84148.1 transcription factor FapR [Staphylococcus piscifermentans]SNV05560.1 fatty acid biosynthesis transcriptional regulator [Staphylococcus piscifermentans]